MLELVYKTKNEKLFWQYWQKFLSQNKIGPKYLPASVKSDFFESAGNNFLIQDLSFIALKDNQPVAVVLLPLEKHADGLAISLNHGYVSAPLYLPEAAEEVFALIEKIAQDNSAGKIMLAASPLEHYSYNFLEEYNYFSTSYLTYLIDLTALDLFKNCRKGHKSDLKKMIGNKDFTVFFVDKDNADYKLHEEYRMLHYKCSGRITRPKETFDYQYENLKQGNAVLFGLKYKNKNIAFSYFDYNFDKAIYTSGSDDPDYDKLPLYHILVLRAMEYLQKKGVKKLDTGQPSCPSWQMDYLPDQKQLNIALFKRGFGGDYVQSYRGIRYFFNSMFKTDLGSFTNNYCKSLYVSE